MLDTGTKRRIDTARDILVGKVPDPKSQVEQITIALIYKFMDDMDAESEELGGKRKFFAGEFARYGWAKLMRSGLGGNEILNLYAEAIARMPENPGIPLLFRSIFKNAYLPYRDPETLKMFLKVIDEFEYDHSERLGDAFEYLLSVLGSQGDAGQFRTPRHIIDFIVALVDPRKDETVLDPACGTAGFLISSYKHILRSNSSEPSPRPSPNGRGRNVAEDEGVARGDLLTPDEKGRLAENFRGYDISPDMVRLSLVNMYLHGFADPHIFEYDTLSSQERWGEYADVILANPPFMSPKGGIKPHNRFSVQSKRSEVLFVDYMAEHLTPNGRAGIIVPEGIIFQSQNAYTQLRKMLVEEYLVAVVSLPAGVFNPYSGVKTSILVLDKSLAKQASTIAFFKIENDGFGLGAQRREIDKNNLPQARAEIVEYLRRLRVRESVEDFSPTLGLVVPKEKIAANGDYNLSGERYREGTVSATTYPLVPVGRFMKEGVKTVDPRISPDELFELWSIPAFDAGRPELLRGGEIGSQKKLVIPGDVLLSRIIPHIRRGWVVRENAGGRRQVASTEWIVFASDEVVPTFLRQLLVSDSFHVSFMQTITGVGGSLSRANPAAVGEIQIPLPPLEVQKEIVAEIEGCQKVIDGARAVLDNYRPHIPTHPDWPTVELGTLVTFLSGGTPTKTNASYWVGDIPWVSAKDLKVEQIHDAPMHISPEALAESAAQLAPVGSLLVLVRGMGLANGVPVCEVMKPCAFNQDLKAIVPSSPTVSGSYLAVALRQQQSQFERILATAAHGTLKIASEDLRQIELPLPSLAIQQAIVAEVKAEKALVNANRELITRFEKKIQATLARIWGEETPTAAGREA
jgi:type I restriction enzyme M protein